MNLKNINLELYYIKQKIKNDFINTHYSKWNITSIHFLLSIFSVKKYKKFHNTCLLILSDYIKWFKYDNNYLYNQSYYPSDLEYIYNIISKNILNKIIDTNINYIEILEKYVQNDINNINNNNNSYFDNSYFDNFNFFYIIEIIFFIAILLILFIIKYSFSFMNKIEYNKINNKIEYDKIEYDKINNDKINNDKNITKINSLFNTDNLFNSDILLDKITNLLETNDIKENKLDENNKSFSDFISLIKNIII